MLKIHRVFSIHKTTGHVMDYENVQFIDAASIDTKLTSTLKPKHCKALKP